MANIGDRPFVTRRTAIWPRKRKSGKTAALITPTTPVLQQAQLETGGFLQPHRSISDVTPWNSKTLPKLTLHLYHIYTTFSIPLPENLNTRLLEEITLTHSPESASKELWVGLTMIVESGSSYGIHSETEVITKHRIVALPRLRISNSSIGFKGTVARRGGGWGSGDDWRCERIIYL